MDGDVSVNGSQPLQRQCKTEIASGPCGQACQPAGPPCCAGQPPVPRPGSTTEPQQSVAFVLNLEYLKIIIHLFIVDPKPGIHRRWFLCDQKLNSPPHSYQVSLLLPVHIRNRISSIALFGTSCSPILHPPPPPWLATSHKGCTSTSWPRQLAGPGVK